MTTLIGRENAYTCVQCGALLVTVDRDEGVTPFMLACARRVNPTCGGSMRSAFYPNGPRPAHIPAPTHEWYKPNETEVARLARAEREHVNNGGLLLRPIA